MSEKKMKVKVTCMVCFKTFDYPIGLNEHGFYEIHEARCPNDYFVMEQELMEEK